MNRDRFFRLKVARPLFWHIGVPNDGPLRGASSCSSRRALSPLPQTMSAQYLDARAADDRTICQIGECQVWPERTLIARSARLDIATFEIDPAKLPEMGAVPFDCRKDWPPPEVNDGDTLTLAGYLDTRRNKIRRGYYEHEAWGAHGIVDAVSPREIVTVYNPETTFAANDSVAKASKIYAAGLGSGFTRAARKQGPKDGEKVFKWLRRAN
jgi:hypothetical protein